MLGLGPLRGIGHIEARCCFLERFQESLKHELKQSIHIEKPLETIFGGAASWVGWGLM